MKQSGRRSWKTPTKPQICLPAAAGTGTAILRATLGLLVVMLLDLVLKLAASDGASDHAEEGVTKVLAASVASSSAADGAHQAALTLLRVVGVGGSELAPLALLLAFTTVLLAAGGESA